MEPYIGKLINWLKHSVWVFPIFLLVIFCFLTAFEIHGSSVGMYHKMTQGYTEPDPDLITGSPKPIRSDEWMTLFSWISLQSQTGYPPFNEHLNSGRDVSLAPAVPTNDWIGFFRPHNFSYFVMPFENAFAFSWWFGLLLLMIASYFFVLRILKSKLIAILLSLSFSLSPIILWWYRVDLLLPLAYFFMASILTMRLMQKERIPWIKSEKLSVILYLVALAYVGVSFGLILYAPFLIPIFIVLAVFILGYVIDGVKSGLIKIDQVKKTLLYSGGVIASVAVAGAFYYFEKREVINTVANEIYPGHREIHSGQLPFSPLYRIFDGFLMPFLQDHGAGSYYSNQSEASNFILLIPFLLIPAFLLQFYLYKKNKSISWAFLFINILSLIFIVRITLPIGDDFFKLFLLDRVPNNRLLAGLGLAGFIQLIYLIKQLKDSKIPTKKIYLPAIAYSFVCFGWLLVFLKFFVFQDYPNFATNRWLAVLFAILFSLIIVSFLMKKNVIGATLLLFFTAVSSFHILPFYRGLNFYENGNVINTIRQVSQPDDEWVVLDSLSFETLPLIAGRGLINGPQPYTDLSFWRKIDQTGQYEDIYNRQGHALFITNTKVPGKNTKPYESVIQKDFELVKGNLFKVKFSCSKFTYEEIDFVLIDHALNFPCLKQSKIVDYPSVDFYIYEVVEPDK